MEQEEVWDAIALKWKDFRIRPHDYVGEFLDGKKGRILDLGCGSGRNFVTCEGLEFFGVDFSVNQLKEAGVTANRLGIEVELSKADVWKVPFGKDTRLREREIDDRIPDISKINSLGWEPKTRIAEGIKKIVSLKKHDS